MTSPTSSAGSAPDLPDYAPAATAGRGSSRLGLALVVIASAQLMVVLDGSTRVL